MDYHMTAMIAVFSLSLLIQQIFASGPCAQQELLSIMTKNNNGQASWYPDPCTRCSCSLSGDTEECEEEACLAPSCSKDQILTFSSGTCCASCKQKYTDCLLDGLTVKHGTSHRNSQCELCDCTDGQLDCKVLSCSQVQCSSKVEDECCRKCSTNMCEDNGQLHSDKSAWLKDNCVLCQCDKGVKSCYAHICPPLDCRHAYTPEGACCPICPNDQCWSNGELYKNGQTWNEDECTSCVCISGKPQCFTNECFEEQCPPTMRLMKEPGACCPSCVPSFGMCIDGPTTYYNGQIWNISQCDYCVCDNGRITCSAVQCNVEKCAENEYLYTPKGACCPICKLREVCVSDSLVHITKEFEVWSEVPCKICMCKDGQAQCYHDNSCSTTPDNNSQLSVKIASAAIVIRRESTVISTSNLDINATSLDDVRLRVIQAPAHGTLHGGRREFSYRELADGLLYQHDGSADEDDYVLFQASNTETTQNVLLPINVKSSEGLAEVTNSPLNTESAKRTRITSSNLLFEAGNKQKQHLIEYTITNPPKLGSLVMMIPQDDGAQPLPGWSLLPDGNIIREVFKFRQSDINDGYIYYQHESANSTESVDSFLFDVIYKDSGSVLKDNQLYVNIILGDVYDAPSVAPGSSLQVTVPEGETVVLTTSHLSFTDKDTHPSLIVYQITEPLASEQGYLEFNDDPQIPITSFTQQDVNNGVVSYRSPENLEVGSKPREFSFKFTVSDDTSMEIQEQTFNIVISPVDNKPPSASTPTLNGERSGSILISDESLMVHDEDTPKEDLRFTIAKAPKHGDIVKLIDRFHTILREGDAYSYSEILSNTLYYVHDGSTGSSDAFTLMLTDSSQAKEFTIPVNIQYSDNDAPALTPGATMKIKVKEGQDRTISIKDLSYDELSVDGLVLYQVAGAPRFGELRFKSSALKKGDGFTQPDIAAGSISYKAHEELGNIEIIDTIFLNVSDTAGNMAAMQPFAITIQAEDNSPPTITFGEVLQVEEGRRKQITKKHISAEDPDSTLTNLMVVIDSVPTLGLLKIITSDNRELITKQSQVQMFLLSDLYAGLVYYDQYDHINKEPRNDFFWFHVSDGENDSPVARYNITILPRNDEAPTIVADTLFVEEGSSSAILNSSVYISDIDTEFDGSPSNEVHILTVVSLPREGTLQWRNGTLLVVGSRFGVNNLSGDLLYKHNGREDVSQDAFVLTVSDGQYEDTKTIPVDIALMDDETPRVKINDGLRVKAGGDLVIDSTVLHATDIDSNDETLSYYIREPPRRGILYLVDEQGSRKDNIVQFTPQNLLEGNVRYQSERMSSFRGGFDLFKFDVVDENNNVLRDQIFYIDIIEDNNIPMVRVNSPLTVMENSFGPITTSNLYITDLEVNPENLVVYVVEPPKLGNIILEDDRNQAHPISNFTMADIVSNRVFYIHESDTEELVDMFRFTATDGTNNVTQSFRIRMIPVDDSLPVVTAGKISTSEGQEKTITEFELRVTDNDTRNDKLQILIKVPPAHGEIVVIRDGQAMTDPCLVFTMDDVYQGLVKYKHDGSETTADSFTYVISDQTNEGFIYSKDGQMLTTSQPLAMEISIQLVDDGNPTIAINKGIPYLEYTHNHAFGLIHKDRLTVSDVDTLADHLVYKITRIPRYGMVVKSPDNQALYQFTQADINNRLISYMLNDEVDATEDSFIFDVMDTKPNILSGIEFHITWTSLNVGVENITISETDGVIEIPVVRTGSLSEFAAVSCLISRLDVEEDSSGDLNTLTPQIQFEKGVKTSSCILSVVDDDVFENVEAFQLELSAPDRALLGAKTKTFIQLKDPEDEPFIQFADVMLSVEESVGTVSVLINRTGDTSKRATVLCSTKSVSATGSKGRQLQTGADYITKTDAEVKFDEGQASAVCDIRVLDDTAYEGKEEFEVILSAPTEPARLGKHKTATVVINGPNDESAIEVLSSQVTVFEDEEYAIIEVTRNNLDLRKPASVWCTTKMTDDEKSAKPNEDYIPSSQKVTFEIGQSKAECKVRIVDDESEVKREGPETFAVFITAADTGSVIGQQDTAIITIDDSDTDIPLLSFETAKYTVNEDNGTLSVPIIRTGDVSCVVSVICYTRQQTASVMKDYIERPFTNSSRVEIQAGQRTGSCDLNIVNDMDYETSEFLLLRLAEPAGCSADLGDLDVTLINIVDPEDEPKLSFTSASYTIREPASDSIYESINVKLHRVGDNNEPAQVRVSTRDGSALSGIDYAATSQILKFQHGEQEKIIEITILYNADIEWHETFSVVIEDIIGAAAGDNSTAVINILDTDISGSLVLPAVPMVVPLNDFMNKQTVEVTQVSTGYPLVCLSPCDPLYPNYKLTENLCKASNINPDRISYSWELSYPVQSHGKVSSFLRVSQDTRFSRVNTQLLEAFYFRAGFRVRCVATPLQNDGRSGVALKSLSVEVHSNGVCSNPIVPSSTGALGAQSFMARLEYVSPDAGDKNGDRIHISVEIPHQDGMIPVLSTMPIYNIDYLLTQPSFSKQHLCSNLPNTTSPKDASPVDFFNTLPSNGANNQEVPSRTQQAIQLYRHLDEIACLWRFEAWYKMVDLVDQCGGRVVHNFDVESASRSFVTVHQPLHVSYVYAKAPSGWVSLDHQTMLEASFYYDNVKFQSGADVLSEPDGDVEILRIGIGDDGKMAVQLRSQAHFKGLFVMDHYTGSQGQSSKLYPPTSVETKFDLELLWSQPTFDTPVQIWRAISRFSLQDYSGEYKLGLLACVANIGQVYDPSAKQQKCAVQKTLEFPLKIAFQQSNRPVPAVYSLSTQFQLTNSERMFLMDPKTTDLAAINDNFYGIFNKGEKLYGRVYWNAKQDLESAFRLQIDKVFICTGRNGYIPTYDPTGEIYNEGPQYGCLESSDKLKHRFLVLDRGQDEVTSKVFNGLPFKASFADSTSGLTSINNIPSTDGFVMNIDPLFSTTSGQRWYVHVLYRIGAADSVMFGRRRREISQSNYKTGNNLILINLNYDKLDKTLHTESLDDEEVRISYDTDQTEIPHGYVGQTTLILVLIVVLVVIVTLAVCVMVYVRRTAQKGSANISTAQTQSNVPSNANLPPIDSRNHITLNNRCIGTEV